MIINNAYIVISLQQKSSITSLEVLFLNAVSYIIENFDLQCNPHSLPCKTFVRVLMLPLPRAKKIPGSLCGSSYNFISESMISDQKAVTAFRWAPGCHFCETEAMENGIKF